MPSSLTDTELASKLEQQQVDRAILNEAARRIRECDMQHLLLASDISSAIQRSPLLDQHQSDVVEKIVMSVPPRRQSSARLSSLAARILRGGDYTRSDVMSLAASVLSQDETSTS
jgi:hypothetical protein